MSWLETDEAARKGRAVLEGADDGAQDALTKMARAHKRGTGCHITADEIRSLSITRIGEMWAQPDPRKENKD